MALYKVLNKDSSKILPSPSGPLLAHMPSSLILQANKKVKPLLEVKTTSKTRVNTIRFLKRRRQ